MKQWQRAARRERGCSGGGAARPACSQPSPTLTTGRGQRRRRPRRCGWPAGSSGGSGGAVRVAHSPCLPPPARHHTRPRHPAAPLLARTLGRTDCCTRADFPAKEVRLAKQEAVIDATAAMVASGGLARISKGFWDSCAVRESLPKTPCAAPSLSTSRGSVPHPACFPNPLHGRHFTLFSPRLCSNRVKMAAAMIAAPSALRSVFNVKTARKNTTVMKAGNWCVWRAHRVC